MVLSSRRGPDALVDAVAELGRGASTSGTWSDLLRFTAVDQMRQAGVRITSGAAAFVEMLHDNASPIAGEFYAGA